MLNWMLWNKNDFKVSHRNQVNAPPNMKLMTSLMNFECQKCGIFVGLLYINKMKSLILLFLQLL